MPIRRIAIVAAACLAVGACKKASQAAPAADSAAAATASDALPKGHVPIGRAIPLEPAAQAVLDSANALYKAKDYTGALAMYRRTLEVAPGHPAPWFGISMAANQLGNKALADSASKLLQERGAVSEQVPGAPTDPHGGAMSAPVDPHSGAMPAPTDPHGGTMPANPHGAAPKARTPTKPAT